MKYYSSKIIFILLLVTIAALAISATPTMAKSIRLLADKPRACDKYPSVCGGKGSSGPDCCNKQCVNVMTDKLNCGKCGKKCNYSQMCCEGECVNPSVNVKHCGRCNHKCYKGSSCAYGLCSYA